MSGRNHTTSGRSLLFLLAGSVCATPQPRRPGLASAIWQSNPSFTAFGSRDVFAQLCSVRVCAWGELEECEMLTLKNKEDKFQKGLEANTQLWLMKRGSL